MRIGRVFEYVRVFIFNIKRVDFVGIVILFMDGKFGNF